ncbi:hypothetical protein ACFSTA_02135 [Ornithinibacillus salinisoli]|uniref:DUF1430 domain-containing protein n=1 Tax=Ornithinibacillus salinisoli TaxID=1848459 RepID=A0ABW4VV35_9BACI
MKKIVIFMIAISYMFSIYFSFEQIKNRQVVDYATIDNEIGHPFVIPNSVYDETEDLYSVLHSLLNEELIILHDISRMETSRNIIFSITFLIFIYYIFSQTKQIGIMKLHGVTNFHIWWGIIGRLITISVLLALLVGIFMALIFKIPIIYWLHFTIPIGTSFFILLISTLVCYFVISNINVSNMLKKTAGRIITINAIVKVIIGVIIILLSMESFQYNLNYKKDVERFQTVSEQQNEWRDASNEFGVLQAYIGYSSAHNFEELENELAQGDQSLYELYPYLNDIGSIVIDASQYEEENLFLNQNFSGIFSMIVNVNYLDRYSILDENGEQINIREDEGNWIILIPEQYKHEEEEIINYFEGTRDFYIPEEYEPEIKLIWIKEGQRSFTMNPNVYPQENNYVLDPVVQVKTTSNHLFLYRGGIRGNGLSDPMKINLPNGNSSDAYNELLPVLEKHNLADSTKISSINDFITERIQTQHENIRINLYVIFGLILLYIMVSLQNVIIQFHSQSRRFVIQQLFGISFFRTYQSVFLKMILIYVAIILLTLIANDQRIFTSSNLIPSAFSTSFLFVAIIILIIDIVTLTLSLIIIEKRSKVNVIKSVI